MTTRTHDRSRAALVVALAIGVLGACAAQARPKPDKERRMLEHGLALLQKKDTASICEGAKVLGGLGKPDGIEPLLAHLRTRDESARECVREALAKLDVAPALVAKWRSDDVAAQDQALEQAVALPHPGLMAIHREAARDTSAARRKRVATGLRRQAEGPEVWALLEVLVADPDQQVRWWAIDTLSLSKSGDAERLLRQRLPDEQDAALRTLIERALTKP